ncbi:MAG: hypothetical protein KME23_08865 [Goleter apudmare HA4340-LM2]|nr:hypothetical protein [Goleter apudmare HA4340-LM2]
MPCFKVLALEILANQGLQVQYLWGNRELLALDKEILSAIACSDVPN